MGGYLEGRSIAFPGIGPPGSLNSRTPWWHRDAPDWSMGSVCWSGRWVGHPSLLRGSTITLSYLNPQWINGTWSTYTIYWVNLPGCLLKEKLSEGICPPKKRDGFAIHQLADEFSKAQKSVDLVESNDVRLSDLTCWPKVYRAAGGSIAPEKKHSLLRGI